MITIFIPIPIPNAVVAATAAAAAAPVAADADADAVVAFTENLGPGNTKLEEGIAPKDAPLIFDTAMVTDYNDFALLPSQAQTYR